MNSALFVTKRDGRKEAIDLDKIHKVVDWAAAGLDKVSVSEVELKAHLQFFDGITTSEIHETLIKAAADLISEDVPDYQYLAARLNIFHLRKKAYGQFEPPALFDHVQKMVADQRYDAHLLEDYTPEEFAAMDAFIDHSRDMTFSYAAVKQLEGKYLVQNRVSGEIYESAQFLRIDRGLPVRELRQRTSSGFHQAFLQRRFDLQVISANANYGWCSYPDSSVQFLCTDRSW